MFAFRQIGFRRKAPVAILIHRRTADQRPLVVDIDVIDIAGRFTGEGRARIVSDAAVRDRTGHRSDVVGQAQRTVNDTGGAVVRRGHVERKVPALVIGAADRGALVACLVHRRCGQRMFAFRQIGFRRKAPVAILIHRRAADQRPLVVDIDVIDIAGRFTGEGRARIVSDAAVRDRTGHRSDVVGQAQRTVNDTGGAVVRRGHVERKVPALVIGAADRGALVACLVHRRCGQRMFAFRQIGFRRKAPVAILIHRRAADQRPLVVDIDVIDIAGRFTGEGRARIVSDAAVRDRTGHRSDVVGQAQRTVNDTGGAVVRRGHVERKVPALVIGAADRGALVACLIHRRCGQRMFAFRQIGFRRKAPVAILIHRRAADQFAVVVDIDVIDIAGRFTGEGRARIVSDAAVRDRTGHRSDVVGQAQRTVNDTGGAVVRRGHVERKVPALVIGAADRGALVACLVHRRCGQRMFAFRQIGFRRKAPVAILIHRRAADQFAIIIDIDVIDIIGGFAREGRAGIVGDAAVQDRAGHRSDVVSQAQRAVNDAGGVVIGRYAVNGK